MAEKITFNGEWVVPNNPEVGFIVGDGIGTDVTPAAIKVINAAVEKAYNGERQIDWQEILVGEVANEKFENYLPDDSIQQIKDLKIVLKGPLTTPVGGGFRSLNVAIRQILDLYSCVRPVRYFNGLPAPVTKPENVDIVLFRENTEDVYAGIEWPADSEGANELISWVKSKGKEIREHSGVGIKPISAFGSERIVRAAMEYAIAKKRKRVTLVHKGNIMKFTEGAFKDWGFDMIKREYADKVVFENDLSGEVPEGKILVNDRIADAMFQQILLRPKEYDVVATMNLNGDYLSDAAAAQVGGLGIAPGANIGDGIAVFEATHGTAPKYSGMDKVNPGSIILSGVMMLELMGWDEAADLIISGMEKTFLNKTVTYDLERQMEGATLLKCSEFAQAIVDNM